MCDSWPTVSFTILTDVTGVKLKRFSFSLLDVVASGVGIRGRFFNGPVVLIDPLRLNLESVCVYCGCVCVCVCCVRIVIMVRKVCVVCVSVCVQCIFWFFNSNSFRCNPNCDELIKRHKKTKIFL